MILTPEERMWLNGFYDSETHSEKVRRGIQEARDSGKYIGHRLTFCFQEEVDELGNRLQDTPGNRATVVPIDDVMAMARSGLSVGKAAGTIGICANTLKNALIRVGRYDEYREIFHASSGRKGAVE